MKNSVKALFRKVKSTFRVSAEADVYVISYPKSGRTWLRTLIGKYLSLKYKLPEDEILSADITSQIGLPSVSFTHDESAMFQRASYQEMSHDWRKYTNKKVILLGREIKDTLVSAYFQATKRTDFFEGTISAFIVTEQFGVEKVLTFYDIWLQNRHVPESFLFIRYEDLHQDPQGTLGKILNFIGEVNVDDNLLEQSVEYCSIDNLKRLEAQNKFKNDKLTAIDPQDPNSYKVREGKVGGHTKHLSPADQALIDEAIDAHQFDLNNFYEPATSRT